MSGRSSCPECGTILRIRDRTFVGRRVNCPECKTGMRITTEDAQGDFVARRLTPDELASSNQRFQDEAKRRADKILLPTPQRRSLWGRLLDSPLTVAWLLAIGVAVFVAVLAEHQREMLFFHHARLAGEGHAAGHEERLRLAHAEWLERFVVAEEFVVDLAEGEFGVEVDAGLEFLCGEVGAGVGEKGGAESREARLLEREAGGHFVTAMLFQKLPARRERGDEREAGDAAPAAFASAGFIEADDQRGPIHSFMANLQTTSSKPMTRVGRW